MIKRIGKIKEISFGFGGYNDAMLGVSVILGSDKESWGIGDFKGTWANRSDGAKWSVADQIKTWGETVAWVRDLLQDAKKLKVEDLAGTPVEVTFDGNSLKSWRVLTEVV